MNERRNIHCFKRKSIKKDLRTLKSFIYAGMDFRTAKLKQKHAIIEYIFKKIKRYLVGENL